MANNNLHVAWCTAGIMLSLMVYSVLQVPSMNASRVRYVNDLVWRLCVPLCVFLAEPGSLRHPQERIMTQPFGAEGELFTFSLFLVLCNRITTCALSMACLLVCSRLCPLHAPMHDVLTPTWCPLR